MKAKMILFLFFLCSGYAVAQEYKYFDDISLSRRSLLFFRPKGTTLTPEEVHKGAKPGPPAFRVVFSEKFYKLFDPFFKEIFGFPYSGDTDILKKIKCNIHFDKNLKIYYYSISYPASHAEEFRQWEEKLYRFCELCKTVDIKPFMDIRNKEKFRGGGFTLNLFMEYLYSENPSRILFDNDLTPKPEE